MRNDFPGLFLVLEGLDGSGTTTQAEFLARHFEQEGYSVLKVEEPGGTALGRQVRDILLQDRGINMEPLSELLLFEVSRAQLVREKIIPGLDDGKIIISDRFAISSVAYQGYGRGIPVEQVKQLNRIAVGGVRPDLTFFLDIGLAEWKKRYAGKKPDRIEKEREDFFRRVREGYREEIKLAPDTVKVDGAREKGEISRELIDRIEVELESIDRL